MANGLVPDIGFQLGRGLQTFGGLQQQQLQRQQFEAQQAQTAQEQSLLARQQAERQAVLGSVPQQAQGLPVPGAAPVAGLPALGPAEIAGPPDPLRPDAIQAGPTGIVDQEALQRLAVSQSDVFKQISSNLGLITQGQKDEAADFAFRLQNTPFEQREGLIRDRVRQLRSEGRNASDTASLSNLDELQQNSALNVVRGLALTPEARQEREERRRELGDIATSKAAQDRLTAEVKTEADIFKKAEKLRGEITKVSTEFNKLDSAFGRIEATAIAEPSAAGDISLIFNFMKMNDPGSTVREGEFATAQNATGVSNRIRNQYNNIVRGERLNPEQRQDFFNSSKRIFDRAKDDNTKAVDKIVDIGDQFGVSRDQLLGREQAATVATGKSLQDLTPAELSNLSTEELQALVGGAQ